VCWCTGSGSSWAHGRSSGADVHVEERSDDVTLDTGRGRLQQLAASVASSNDDSPSAASRQMTESSARSPGMYSVFAVAE